MRTIAICVLIGLVAAASLQAIAAPAFTSSSDLAKVDVGTLDADMDRAEYIRAAAIQQYQLIELCAAGKVTVHGYDFVATPETLAAMKTQIADLRTRVVAAQNGLTLK